LNVLVPVVGLAYFVVYSIIQFATFILTTGALAPFQYIFLPFVVVSGLAAVGIWRNYRAGYVASIGVSGLLAVMISIPSDFGVSGVFANPADTGAFFAVVTNAPILYAVLIYSVLGLRERWRIAAFATRAGAPGRTIPRSSVVAFLAVGFIVGGLMVGLLAGATQQSLLANSGVTGDITIATGASSSTNSQFFVPQSYTVKAGATVIWVNRDATGHTVTSTTGLFDSGSFASGTTFKYMFAQAGTYPYYCTIHPWMKGTIVVTSG
jgi:plastocyanin